MTRTRRTDWQSVSRKSRAAARSALARDEGGKLDHLEIYAFQTGAGMAITPPRTDANAKAESLTTGEGDTALTPENVGQWAASQERRTGSHSGSRPSRIKPERGKGGASHD
jgi:hypothetical protein